MIQLAKILAVLVAGLITVIATPITAKVINFKTPQAVGLLTPEPTVTIDPIWVEPSTTIKVYSVNDTKITLTPLTYETPSNTPTETPVATFTPTPSLPNTPTPIPTTRPTL